MSDACPSCEVNVEPPRASTPITNGTRYAYACTDCGHAWTADDIEERHH